MPRTAIPVTEVGHGGAARPAATPGDATNEMYIDNSKGGKILVEITNADGAAGHDTTFVTPGDVEGQAIADAVVTTPASGVQLWSGEEELFNQKASPDKGHIFVNVTSTQLSYRAYRVR
jgi:hypothetical protein